MMDNWILVGIDDGNLLFDASLERRSDLGLPIIHQLLSTVRKSRINIFCCTQTPHQLGASIHSNATIKIMFRLTNGQDIDFMFRSFGNLTKEQKEFCYSLGERQVIIKNSIRHPQPVFGIIPEVSPTRKVSDSEINENNKRMLSDFPAVVPRYEPQRNTDNKHQNESINDNQKKFLMAVNIYQYQKSLTEISKLAGFSAGSGSRIAADCEKRNLIKIIQVKFWRGSPKYPVLLTEAYKTLGIQKKKFYGKGAGYEHVLYQHLIANHFSKFKPVIELNQNDKFIDVAIKTNELLLAIEVAMTSANEKENIEKDLSKAKADYVIVTCKDEKVLGKVREIISEMPEQLKNKTKVLLVSELLNCNPDELISDCRQLII